MSHKNPIISHKIYEICHKKQNYFQISRTSPGDVKRKKFFLKMNLLQTTRTLKQLSVNNSFA